MADPSVAEPSLLAEDAEDDAEQEGIEALPVDAGGQRAAVHAGTPGGQHAGGQRAAPDPRPWCTRCFRAKRVCICDALPAEPLATKTRILVFIHPQEVKRKCGTAPLLKACLSNLVLKEAERFPEPEEEPEFHEALRADGNTCICFFPGPEAEMLQPVSNEEAAARKPMTLLLVDAKWGQAKSMVLRSPWLRDLPRCVIKPTTQSIYAFRKQPAEGCLSTLEAVAEALLALEGERGPAIKAALLAPFAKMVELQCSMIPGGTPDKNTRFCDSSLRTFDPVADVARELESLSLEPVRPPDDAVWCLVRWAERSVGSREMVVYQVMQGSRHEAKAAADEHCRDKTGKLLERGRRCWAMHVESVPPGARYGKPDLVRKARGG